MDACQLCPLWAWGHRSRITVIHTSIGRHGFIIPTRHFNLRSSVAKRARVKMFILGPPTSPSYQYTPITQNRTFRLIRLLPPIHALIGDTPRLEIITADLDSDFSYNTLSYAWNVTGKGPPDRRVIVETSHGSRELRIFRPLEEALLQIKTNRPLFVDQICINQLDTEEKASQVQLMHDIYSQCVRVLVWLGDGTRNSDAYFDFTRTVCEDGVLGRVMGPNRGHFLEVFDAVMDSSIEVSGEIQEDRDDILMLLSKYGDKFPIDGSIDVLKRTWFTRLWIIQEVCLAPTVTFLCGSRSLCWDCFRAGSLFFSIYNTHWVGSVQDAVSKRTLRKREDIFALTKSLIRLQLERRAIHIDQQRKSLYDIVLNYGVNDGLKKIGATLPEDRMFAVMGLAETQSLARVKVRYGDARGVYLEFAALLIAQNVDFLLYSQFPKNIDLPSWVPDWSMDLKTPCGYINGYNNVREKIYNAGGAIREPPQVDLTSGRLTVHGTIIDRIARVGKQSMQRDALKPAMGQVEYASVKRYFDEIDEFLLRAHQVKGDAKIAAIRLSDFGLSYKHLLQEDPQNAEERLKAIHKLVSVLGGYEQVRQDSPFIHHYSRIIKTLRLELPWYWHPGSETDELNFWTRKPLQALYKSIQAGILFSTDVIGIFTSSAIVTLYVYYTTLRSKYAAVRFQDPHVAEKLERVGLDPHYNREDQELYLNNLLRNTGRRLYLSERGYIGTGPVGMQEGDTLVTVYGGSVPHILRKNELAGGNTWSYIGEAYCDGIMDGEGSGVETSFVIA